MGVSWKSTFLSLAFLFSICLLSTRPFVHTVSVLVEPTDHGLKLLKLWATVNLSFLKFVGVRYFVLVIKEWLGHRALWTRPMDPCWGSGCGRVKLLIAVLSDHVGKDHVPSL